MICALFFSLILGHIVDVCLQQKLELQKRPQTVVFVLFFGLLLAMFAPINVAVIQLMCLVSVMVYASYYDNMTSKVERWVHILILVIGSVTLSFDSFLSSALPGLLILFGSLFFINSVLYLLFKKTMIGRGDLFYVSSLGYVFGPLSVLTGLFLGTIFLQGVLFFDKQQAKRAVPFVPYITLGVLCVLLYQWGLVN